MSAEQMEVISKQHTIKQDAKEAATAGIIAGGVVAGYEYYKQKHILDSPIMLKHLKNDVLDSEATIEEYNKANGIKRLLNKIPQFFKKRDLGIKKDMLKKLSNKTISAKAITKTAAFFAIDWAVGSFAIARFLDTLKERSKS